MNNRQLWKQIMHYGDFDRMPVVHWTQWPETRERWVEEGMPEGVDVRDFLDVDPHWIDINVNVGLYPQFKEEIYEETDEYRVFRGGDGVVQKDWKHRECIPHFIEFTLEDASTWPEYKKRLQPDPRRIPEDLDQKIKKAGDSGHPIVFHCASMMGWIRNWMGVQNMSYLMFDSPEVYRDMVDTLAELSCWAIDEVVPRMETAPDMVFCWEDICGRAGPLVSPNIFKEYVAPGYAKIRSKMEEHGIDLLGIDSDGDVWELAGLWLESGVNVLFPLEIGVWKANPMDYREKFGRDLRIIGGFNKMVLEKDFEAIDAEIERRLPLMQDGGFVLMPDHLITPGTPLENYQYFLNRMRELRF
jgi:uroporphyrinogen decarboxylase